MFWRWGKDSDEKEQDEVLDLPPLESLEQWISSLISMLDLEEGTYTFLPAYGGVLLYIRSQGLSWLPYGVVKETLGHLDKAKLVESSALLGGAVAVASGALALPAILIPKAIKTSYRAIAKPSPKSTMNFLVSMIKEIIVEEKKIQKKLLDTFEDTAYRDSSSDKISTYVIRIIQKVVDEGANQTTSVRFVKGLLSYITGSDEPIFVFPPKSDVERFAEILERDGIPVDFKPAENVATGSNDTNKLPKADD